MMFPATIGTLYPHPLLERLAALFLPGTWVYNLTYIGLIVAFAYFYTAVTFNPVDVADNLRKHGGFVPGLRPGKQTAEYLDRILTRLTAGGAVYLAAVILLTIPITEYGLPFYWRYGSAHRRGCVLDTVAQIEGHLLTDHDGLMGSKAGRSRGRRKPAGSVDTWASTFRFWSPHGRDPLGPLAGGTQATAVAEHLGVPHVPTGDIFRKHLKRAPNSGNWPGPSWTGTVVPTMWWSISWLRGSRSRTHGAGSSLTGSRGRFGRLNSSPSGWWRTGVESTVS